MTVIYGKMKSVASSTRSYVCLCSRFFCFYFFSSTPAQARDIRGRIKKSIDHRMLSDPPQNLPITVSSGRAVRHFLHHARAALPQQSKIAALSPSSELLIMIQLYESAQIARSTRQRSVYSGRSSSTRNHSGMLSLKPSASNLLSPVVDGSSVQSCFFFRLAPFAFSL